MRSQTRHHQAPPHRRSRGRLLDSIRPPELSAVIQRIVKGGFRLPTFVRLRRCLDDARRRGEVPDAESMVLALLPWADNHRYRELLRWDLPPQPSSPPLLPI